MGGHAKGVTGLTLMSNNFHHNGAIKKYYHNYYFRRVNKANIRSNKLNNSPSANGLNVDVSKNLNIKKNVASGNYFRGIRVDNSNTVDLHWNKCTNNGNVGIRVVNSKKVIFSYNVATGNKAGNCYLSSSFSTKKGNKC